MRRSNLTLWAVLTMTWAAFAAGPAHAMTGYLWKHRPLVVFAPNPGDARLIQQRDIVNALKPAFIDRQVVVIYVGGDNVTAELGPAPGMNAAALRARYSIAPDEFKVLLLGKDGGVKLTATKPFPAQTLFRTIDAMPMRAEETRRK